MAGAVAKRHNPFMPSIAPLRSGDPTRLGDYDLRGRLGEGGQGVVYFATDSSGRPVAIKWLRPDLSGDPVMVKRFVREVDVAKRVAPFCTAQILSTGIEQDRPYIVSEYVEGSSLQAVVSQDGPRSGANLHRLAIGTATALAAIHQAGIVHRDFKPANVLLAPDGPRVIDFGIARALDATSTISSMPIGTPAYMAPEQILGHSVGPAADMFSWASTMLYAATGNAPFGSDTLPAVINRVLNSEPDLSSLDGVLRDLVTACLSKDPAQRPSAEQVILRLLQHPVTGGVTAPLDEQDNTPTILQKAAEVAAEVAAEGSAPPIPPPSPTIPATAPWTAGTSSHPPMQPTAPYGQPPVPGPPYGQTAPYGGPAMPHGQQGYGGQAGFHGPPPSGAKPRRGGVIAAVVGGVLALALTAALVIVLVNNGDDTTGKLTATTPPATSAPTATEGPTATEEPTTPPTAEPTRVASSVATSDLIETTLPGNDEVTLFEHPSDPVILTTYEIQNRTTQEWEDYARDSLNGKFSRYQNNWETKVSPDGRYLASRGKSYTTDDFDSVVFTDRVTGRRTTVKTVKRPLIASLWHWSNDGTRVLLTIEHNTGNSYSTQGFVIATLGRKTPMVVSKRDPSLRESYYGWMPDSKHVITAATEGDVRSLKVYDLDGNEVRSIDGIGSVPNTMNIFSPSGDRFVTDCLGGDGSQHCIWDYETGTIIHRFTSDCNKTIGWYDEDHLYCWEVDATDKDRVVVVDFAGNSVRTLLEIPDGFPFAVSFTQRPGRS